jgi:adenine-specific DNA-methyltransferase
LDFDWRSQIVIASPVNPLTAKELGAFYTSPGVADFLVSWAIRGWTDRVIDPSFGGGVFLRAAAQRVRELGGKPSSAVFGIEFDKVMHGASGIALVDEGISQRNLREGDFFTVAEEFRGAFDAVVGNPPFIRYQQFSGEMRERATAMMRRQKVEMSELASSWAPFLIGSAGLLQPGGRLAMVVPMELCHASYGRSVLSFLTRSFRMTQLLSFEKRLFPDLSQDTLLLLADERCDGPGQVLWRHLRDADALAKLSFGGVRIRGARKLDASAIAEGRERLIEQFLPSRARTLYGELRRHESVRELGALADIGIGYVSGANNFFHISREVQTQWRLPEEMLRPAVCRGRAFRGMRFTLGDWEQAFNEGDAAKLFMPPPRGSVGVAKRYIEYGESQGVHTGYKCRMREPWYHVPHVHAADGFLTYMSGVTPRLVANEANVVAPNTLHVVRMHPLVNVTVRQLAVAWQSSLTQLSAEIEGHALGGGLLKIEPSEAERILVAMPGEWGKHDSLEALDSITRHGRLGVTQATVDRMILRDQLGLSVKDCQTLIEGAEALRARRLGRE